MVAVSLPESVVGPQMGQPQGSGLGMYVSPPHAIARQATGRQGPVLLDPSAVSPPPAEPPLPLLEFSADSALHPGSSRAAKKNATAVGVLPVVSSRVCRSAMDVPSPTSPLCAHFSDAGAKILVLLAQTSDAIKPRARNSFASFR